jgi:transposase
VDTHPIKKAAKRPKRRRFSDQFKRQIVIQSLEPGASLSALALANELNSNQVFKWRRAYLQQQGEGPVAKAERNVLLPVVVVAHADAPVPAPVSPTASIHAGRIDITLRHGQIRIEGAVDADVLRTLVQSMRA